jgi:large subunit ribosomal protein L10
LALSRQKKEEVMAQYKDWLKNSQAVFLVEYTGVTVKKLDTIRSKVRETGGEFHILKNTLAHKVFEANGMQVPAGYFEKSTAVTFAFTDPASTAKALTDVMKSAEAIKLKGGFLDKQTLSIAQLWPNCHHCPSSAPSFWVYYRRLLANWSARLLNLRAH